MLGVDKAAHGKPAPAAAVARKPLPAQVKVAVDKMRMVADGVIRGGTPGLFPHNMALIINAKTRDGAPLEGYALHYFCYIAKELFESAGIQKIEFDEPTLKQEAEEAVAAVKGNIQYLHGGVIEYKAS